MNYSTLLPTLTDAELDRYEYEARRERKAAHITEERLDRLNAIIARVIAERLSRHEVAISTD